MQIQFYNREQLAELIESDFFKNLDKIPITYHRALSHIHNPDCSEDDILLWVAYENESLMGYVGVLPGVCYINGIPEKIYWLSCFWVDEPYRNSNLASSLFFPLIKRYKDQLFISNFAPSLGKTYQSLGIFHPTTFKTGHRFYLVFCFADIIISRIPKASFLKPFLRGIDNFFNLFLSVRTLAYKKFERKFHLVENSFFDEYFQSFIDFFHKENKYIKRAAEHFEWIIAYPWVLQGKSDKESQRYFFSSKSEQFEYCSLKIYQEKKLLGFILLKIRDKALTISYVYAIDDVVKDIVAYILIKAHKEKLKIITSFDKRLANTIKKNRGRFVFSKKIKRPYIISKKINIASFSFQEGDGDTVFT
ncbi:MAG: GNAT family N-acetyltransferase [bacterium]